MSSIIIKPFAFNPFQDVVPISDNPWKSSLQWAVEADLVSITDTTHKAIITDIPSTRTSEQAKPTERTGIGRHISGRAGECFEDTFSVMNELPMHPQVETRDPNNTMIEALCAEQTGSYLAQDFINDIVRLDSTARSQKEAATKFISLLETAMIEFNALTFAKRYDLSDQHHKNIKQFKSEAFQVIADLQSHYERLGSISGMSESILLMGQLFYTIGALDHAETLYHKALELAKGMADMALVPQIEFSLADLYKANAQPKKALKHLNRGLSVPNTPAEAYARATELFQEARKYTLKNKWDLAIEAYTESSDLFYNYARSADPENAPADPEHYSKMASDCHSNMAAIYLSTNNPSKAEQNFILAQRLAVDVTDIDFQTKLFDQLFKYHLGQDEAAEAANYCVEFCLMLRDQDPKKANLRFIDLLDQAGDMALELLHLADTSYDYLYQMDIIKELYKVHDILKGIYESLEQVKTIEGHKITEGHFTHLFEFEGRINDIQNRIF